jgi:hypothetical protein
MHDLAAHGVVEVAERIPPAASEARRARIPEGIDLVGSPGFVTVVVVFSTRVTVPI